jgi:hypothetical protein
MLLRADDLQYVLLPGFPVGINAFHGVLFQCLTQHALPTWQNGGSVCVLSYELGAVPSIEEHCA